MTYYENYPKVIVEISCNTKQGYAYVFNLHYSFAKLLHNYSYICFPFGYELVLNKKFDPIFGCNYLPKLIYENSLLVRSCSWNNN